MKDLQIGIVKGLKGFLVIKESIEHKVNGVFTFYCSEKINHSNENFERDIIIQSKDVDSLKNGDYSILSAMPEWQKSISQNKKENCFFIFCKKLFNK